MHVGSALMFAGKVKNGEDELHCQLQLQISEFVPQLFEGEQATRALNVSVNVIH